LSGLAVAGEPKALHNHLPCCLPNLHAAFWPGNHHYPAIGAVFSNGAKLIFSATGVMVINVL